MPLSAEGKRILAEFKKEYGPEKGKRYFYAKENRDAKFRRLVTHGKKKR